MCVCRAAGGIWCLPPVLVYDQFPPASPGHYLLSQSLKSVLIFISSYPLRGHKSLESHKTRLKADLSHTYHVRSRLGSPALGEVGGDIWEAGCLGSLHTLKVGSEPRVNSCLCFHLSQREVRKHLWKTMSCQPVATGDVCPVSSGLPDTQGMQKTQPGIIWGHLHAHMYTPPRAAQHHPTQEDAHPTLALPLILPTWACGPPPPNH